MEKKLIHAQQELSKKRKRSSNREKMRHRVAIIHQKVKNQRQDFLHEQSSALISKNQVIYAEDLNTAGMIRNHKLSKSIADASWSTFIIYVVYKSAWYGRKILFIDRFAPSSKMCSECGSINKELKLGDRIWCCKICNTEHDRDINAAKNIKKLGQAMSKVKPEERIASDTPVRGWQGCSKIQEPFSR
jgi:putative transposase